MIGGSTSNNLAKTQATSQYGSNLDVPAQSPTAGLSPVSPRGDHLKKGDESQNYGSNLEGSFVEDHQEQSFDQIA